MSQPLLRTSGLTKRYGSVTVLDQVDLELQAGEIHGLLGANGAGKSTLCKIVAGMLSPSTGTMLIRGRKFRPSNKRAAETLGVDIVQQELNLIPTLSVAENLHLGKLPSVAGVIRSRELHRCARETLDRYGLGDLEPHIPVGELGVGHQQMVEIAAALTRECELLILDEPTAALSATESAQLFQWLDQLRRQGVGILYVSHRLDEVAEIADRITVLRDGKVVCTRSTQHVTTDELVRLMSGEGVHTSSASFQSYATSKVAMRIEGISRGIVQNVSFTVHQGERLGVSGLVGSGRTELLRAIFGADVAKSGSVAIGPDATGRRFHSPCSAVSAGLALVTEDRKQNGLLLTQSVRANTTLAALSERFSRWGLIRQQKERQATEAQCTSMETRCHDLEQSVATLSGGNQQKVVVAKWLVQDAQVFLFDEPTRGIDVAARLRLYRLFESLAASGRGLVIVSSDLKELRETCDRIAVMSAGHLVAIFDRNDWSEEKILQATFSKYVDPKLSTTPC